MKKLVIACYGSNFDDYDHLCDIVDHLRFADAGVELSMFSDKPAYTTRLYQQVERFKDIYVTFHGPYAEVEASAALDSPAHKQILKAYEEAFDLYHSFHAHSIVIHTNQRGFQPEEKEEFHKNVLSTLNEIGQRAAKADVELLVENVGETVYGNMLFDENEFIELFEKLPTTTGCLIDIGHAIMNDWNFSHVIPRLKAKIMAYHLHNNSGTADTHRPLFEKGMKYPPAKLQTLFNLMEEQTPEADWILEYSPGNHITAELMVQDVTILLRMIGRL